MARYVVLGNFTDQGIRAVRDTSKRAKAFRELAKGQGATVKEIFWTMGVYDLVALLDAPSDEVVTSVMMKLGSLGNVRSQTLRAFGESEMDSILSKI